MAKKSTRKKTKKKPASKKSAPKKKSSASATGTSKTSSSRKKTVTKKKSTRKKTKKKVIAKKKTPTKKKTTKKSSSRSKVVVKKKSTDTAQGATSKKTSRKAADSASGVDNKGAASTKKKKTKGKSTVVKIGRGRSVAEVASTATADAQGYVVINGRRVRMISTKGVTPAKKPRSTTAVKAEDAEAKVAAKPAKPIKTKLTKRQLDHYKKLLLIKRGELVGDLSTMEAEALRSSDGDLSNMPIHMADLGSDTYEQDFMLGMAQNERERLREIDEALQRIADRTYGICKMTGEPIPKARLEAKPWAKYTIEAARQLEGSWVPR